MIHSTSNNSSSPLGPISPNENKTAAKNAAAAQQQDKLDTTNSTALREALAAQPEVRTEVVAKGRELSVDASYPPRTIIENIAKLFINSQDLSNQA